MNPAKNIPRLTKFYSVIIYAFAVVLQKLVLFPSCTLYDETNFLAVGHPIKCVPVYVLDWKHLLARK